MKGGRGVCTPSPQRTMSYLVLCPPCHYLLRLNAQTVRSWSLSTVVEIRFQTFCVEFKQPAKTQDQKLSM